MAEFRLFKICLFLMLPFTAVTQQYTKITVEVGDEVTLPCENGKYFHSRCSSINWLFSDSGRRTATLTEHRQIHKDAGSKSHRLSVTADCSLVIENLTAEDEGRYTCRQFTSGQNFTDSGVDLSVINVGTSPSSSSITVRVGDTATLTCENRKDFQNSGNNTTWLFGGSGNSAAEPLFEHGQIHKDAGSKSHRLSVTADCSLVIEKLTAEDEGRYTCRQFRSGQLVTDSAVDLSVINADEAGRTEDPNTGYNTGLKVLTKTTLISLAAGFAVLFIIMAVIGWRRVKRNKTQRSDETELNSDYCTIPDTIQDRAHPAAGVSYTSVNKTNNKTRVHNKYHKGDLWARISTKSARDLSDDNIYINMRPK